MKVTAEPTADSQVVLSIEVDPEQVEKSVERAYQRIVQRANIPGFRRGKAPRAIVERRFGTESLYREALDFLLPEAYSEALKESQVEPVAEPEVEIVQMEPSKPLIFKATVPLRPKVDPGDYRSIRLEPEPVVVTDAEIDAELERIRERQAEWVPVTNRTARMGDRVTVDYVILSGSREADGRQVENAEFVLGENDLFEGFGAQIEGSFVGQQVTVRHVEKSENQFLWLPDQEVVMQVTIKAIREKELPPLDDEFARANDFASLEAMREELRTSRQMVRELVSRDKFTEQLITRVMECAAPITLPPAMIEEEIDELVARSRRRLANANVTLERYLQDAGKSMDDLRLDLRDEAIRQAKRALILEAIGEAEHIEVSEQEIQEGIDETLQAHRHEGRRVLERARQSDRLRHEVRRSILRHKAIEFLADMAKAKEGPEAHGSHPDGD